MGRCSRFGASREQQVKVRPIAPSRETVSSYRGGGSVEIALIAPSASFLFNLEFVHRWTGGLREHLLVSGMEVPEINRPDYMRSGKSP